MTTEQIRQQTKTVTRRIGWKFAKVGDVVQPVLKAQGLKKGETVTKIGGPIRFVAVDGVILGNITPQDVHREGFSQMTACEFVAMFKKHNGGSVHDAVTRIQFEYVDSSDLKPVGGGH